MGQFLPARLKKAREDAGLTQESFARSLGLSSEFISLLEAGKRAPSLETLSRISAALHKDAAFFLGDKEPAFKVLFRAPAVEISQIARQELERFRRYVDDYMRLEEATGRTLELAPLYSGRLSPERMAAEERRRLGLGDEPVRDIFALLERNGLRILRGPLPPAVAISGVFVFLEARNAAFALINSAQTPCRQAFTAVHEYCHYLKDRSEPPIIDTHRIFEDAARPKAARKEARFDKKDQFAQEFAAHFLMPPAKVREIVERDFGAGRLSYDDVLLIKRYFGVSAQAMLRALCNLGLLTAGRHQEYARLDPVQHEKRVFGGTDEDYGPGSGLDSAGIVVSDRYRLMEREVSSQ
ncbi:MAG TPA: helix-turn-helix domain-containing protein [Candidatus Aminicenantes bacterium]|nr:helix-turn-helix domain-containing protein [Candidatus Aminicenantes bacterium]HRY65573.1 helix-turn-helix domain-containing protein [Candidatus Aminicenantes bacterium]HRZ72539.1 helix-turn-helix domain-containing protein [Candidatus Aminicenantes bacterium]